MPSNRPIIDVFDELFDTDPRPKEKIEQDIYGFKPQAELIKETLETVRSYHTIGILGPWGSGKTTLKNFIVDLSLRDEQSTLFPVTFDAWAHEQESGLLLPLLAHLCTLAGLTEKDIKTMSSVLVLAFADIFLKATSAGLCGLDNIIKAEKYARSNFLRFSKYGDPVLKTKKDFSLIINSLISRQKKDRPATERIVIFIDELDRCTPDNAIKLLESIKNYFEIDNCFFVLSVDDQVLASYIDKKYENTKMNGFDYLDKILTIKFSVPKISKAQVVTYVKEIRNTFLFDIDADLLFRIEASQTPRRLRKQLTKLRLIMRHSPPEVLQNMLGTLGELPPPKWKQLLFSLIILKESYPKLYRRVFSWDEKYFGMIKSRLLEAEGNSNASLTKDLLALTDLREEDGRLLNYVLTTASRENLIKANNLLIQMGIL